MRLGVTPVPIPNTMVKTQAADGTALETVWESRWLPDLKKENWFYQWSEDWRDSVFWWLMKQAVRMIRCEALKSMILSLMALHANALKSIYA